MIARATEKEYFLREMAGVASASLEICLLPLSLLLLLRQRSLPMPPLRSQSRRQRT